MVGLVAVLGRAQLTANAVPVPLLAAVVGMALLRWLIRRLAWQPWPAPSRAAPAGPLAARPGQPAPARRRFLQVLGGTAAVAAVAGLLASTLRGAAAVVSEVRSKLALPAARRSGAAASRPAPRSGWTDSARS